MLRNNLARFNSADSNTQRTAVHEAGHAVQAKLAGATEVRAWVNFGTVRRAGTCSWRSSVKISPFQRLLICAAGAAAEVAVFGSMGSDESVYAGDMRNAKRHGCNREQFFDAVWSLSETLDVDAVMAQEVTTRRYNNR